MSSDETIRPPDPRPHLNLVFIGHVDAGKSTTCGNMLYLSGLVDQRTIEKYEREAKTKNRESWFLAYIMDTNEEERSKGITVEVGRALFETPNRRFTILDAPGHRTYVPNMIAGASQADIAVLLISARKGEFEAGFDKSGQTREHVMLSKTLGVNKLIVAVNKMDDPTVGWSKERYDEIIGKLNPFLKARGFNVKSDQDVQFIPISGLKGQNLKERWESTWYTGPTLWEILDTCIQPFRDHNAPLRIPIIDVTSKGTIIGKVEQGVCLPGSQCVVLPLKYYCEVEKIYIEDVEYSAAFPGENIRVKLKGTSQVSELEDQIRKGYVLSGINSEKGFVGISDTVSSVGEVIPVGNIPMAPIISESGTQSTDSSNLLRVIPRGTCPVVSKFKARMLVTDLLEHKPILCSGYRAVLHVHTVMEECCIDKIYEVVDQKKDSQPKKAMFAVAQQLVTCIISLDHKICVDLFERTPQLGRFTIRDEGKTIAIGKITQLPSTVE